MYGIFILLLTLLLIGWGLYILAYVWGFGRSHPLLVLGRMIAGGIRALLWALSGCFELFGAGFTALGKALRRLLEQ